MAATVSSTLLGTCVRIEGDIVLDQMQPLAIGGLRLVGPPCINGIPQASIKSLHASLLNDLSYFENLRITGGIDWEDCESESEFQAVADRAFPAVEVLEKALFKHCHIIGYQVGQSANRGITLITHSPHKQTFETLHALL